jgi:rare lipoprotein A
MRAFALIAATILLSIATQLGVVAAEPVTGKAAVYSDAYHGKKTATGEVYDKNGLSAASNVFPLGSMVHVKHRVNGKHVVVRINDTQAKSNKHILDLSRGAARKLGVTTGHIPVDAHIVKTQEKE